MEIVHFGPYGPHRAGIYEAARDMVRADVERGHLTSFVDVGPTRNDGVQEPPQIGAVDDRGDFQLVTMPPQWADSADILIYHTGVPDNWVVRNEAPIISMIHGRPLATFRPEQNLDSRNGYSVLNMLGEWPRVKKFVYFWPEFTAYWRNIIPEEKLAPIDYPPIDLKRFTPDGPVHKFAPEHKGTYNALIADAWREDIDVFEITNGAIEAVKQIPGLRVHMYSVETVPDTPGHLPPCWQTLMSTLAHRGGCGEISGRQPGLEEVFRAVDFVMSPNRIVTRIIGEALACGVPVLAAQGCKVTPYTADIFDPHEVGAVAMQLVDDLQNDPEKVKADCRATAEALFSLERYGKAIEQVYQEVTA